MCVVGHRCSSSQEIGRISTPPQSNRQPSVGSERVRRSPMFCVQYLVDFSTDSSLRPTNMYSELLSQISIRGIWYNAATVDPTQRLPLTVSLLRSPLCRRGVGQKFGSPKKNPEMVFSDEVLPCIPEIPKKKYRRFCHEPASLCCHRSSNYLATIA